MSIWQLSIGILISGVLAIWFGYRQPRGWFYFFKPLTMILIIMVPILEWPGFSSFSLLMVAGMVLSMVGDILLMLPGDRFLEGLAAFLLAHLFYIAGFLIDQGGLVYWPALPIFGLAGLMAWVLSPALGTRKVPVYTYMGVISVMVWTAGSRWISGGEIFQLLGFCGAGLFMISDLILALNRFKVEFKSARGIDLAAYYAGQWLIALSLIGMSS